MTSCQSHSCGVGYKHKATPPHFFKRGGVSYCQQVKTHHYQGSVHPTIAPKEPFMFSIRGQVLPTTLSFRPYISTTNQRCASTPVHSHSSEYEISAPPQM